MKLLQIKRIKDQYGFSMVELLIVILLIFLIVGMVSAAYLQSISTTRDVINITISEIDSRVAMYRISKDIREAVNISIANNNEVKFTSNIDSDEDYETVHYYLESSSGHYNLMRSIDDGSGKVVITHIVNNELFTYYSALETPEGGFNMPVAEINLNKIKIINITINVDQSGAQSLRTMELDTVITLRNKI